MATEKQKVTVRDLQTFIEAVEFAADVEEWTPSARQWKRIRQMIDDLEATVAPAPVAQQVQQTPQVPYRDPNAPVYRAPAGLPMPQQASAERLAPVFGNPQAPNLPAKTPDIDTSTGDYKSSFA